ncbi:MBL fold metallo-hydrolase [Streptomyces olivaceiscleroticus]|uniref:MBL fold metallo-hydrolase n=1 Tax=Streptomyces olivaceiscleroticus TaxID=68245 RepID=A0ABN1AK85_9ACTN
MRDDALVQVGTGTYLVHGSNTNWVIMADGDAVTLVDTGYPGDHDQVVASLAALGHRPSAVAAILVTHAHSDHIGSADRFAREHKVPVLMHAAEVPHARREFLHQVAVGDVLKNAWRPGVLPWLVHAVRSGGLTDVRMTDPQPFPRDGALDLPGRPVPVHTPGHTGGHCAYHLPDAGVVITGDGLVTGHPTAARLRGPQLLPRMFDTDRARALESLSIVEKLDADVVLPGHGPVHRGEAAAAARHARELALSGR